jgi:heterodisulfide reductase subunit A
MDEVTLEIDGKEVRAKEGTTILEAARSVGINIPTLCYHRALTPYGGCRLCIVEIFRGRRSRIVTSCVYPVEEGLVVKTKSDTVIRDRKMLIELMLARAPKAKVIQDLAKEYGVEKTRFKTEDPENLCILCGLCARVCEERIGVSAINFVGRGVERKVQTPFQGTLDVDLDACIACGACASVCPTEAIKLEDITNKKPIPILSEFEMGLNSRAPIYIPFAQAIPNVATLDRDKCVHFATGECKICEEFCEADAIDFTQPDQVIELKVGSIVACPGFNEFDPRLVSQYGYGNFPNVITSIEFERILSASGPYEGELLRPSDRQKAQKIAWIQCVGSRGTAPERGYCSSVCCTYAIKEAIVAKEHNDSVEATIFFIDIRTFGKGFEAYYDRAMTEYGVRFIRCRPSIIEEIAETKNLTIKYETEDDKIIKEEFDLVVLSVGLEPPKEAEKLANILGIELNKYGFCQTDNFSPVESSKPDIFACGVFQGPKDIPETVTQASAAAASAAASLSSARNSLIKSKEYPPERDTRGEPPRIGVFICHCGINIGGVVDIPQVTDYASLLPNVVYAEDNLYSCSEDTQERIKEKIREHNLNRVVVASCTPRTHEPLFQETIREAGLNKYLFEMANIRDQCSWVHKEYPAEATEKAKELVSMAIAKARLLQPVEQTPLEITHSGLVIGGGIAGMVAALNLAEQGFEVYLAEKSDQLGGIARRIQHTLEGNDVQTYLQNLITKVSENRLIQVYTNADIVEATGYVGNFTTKIAAGPNQDSHELRHGVVIIASGGEEYKPSEYLYGKDTRVMTSLELEAEIAKGNDTITGCNNLVFIQCVGSREDERPYCSRVCCSESIKCALKLKDMNPETNIYILYRDMRTYGFKEDYYREARERGVIFVRYEVDDKPRVETITEDNQNLLRVTAKDPLSGEDLIIDTDILALGVANIPAADNKRLSQLFKVPLNEDGFLLEAHVKLRPVDFATEGVFMCGLAHSPKFIEESIAQAKAAASRAGTILSKDVIEVGGLVSFVNKNKCSGCGVCQLICPFQAIEIDDEEKVAVINEALCKGCGACVSSCICGAINIKGFSNTQILAAIDAA